MYLLELNDIVYFLVSITTNGVVKLPKSIRQVRILFYGLSLEFVSFTCSKAERTTCFPRP